MMFSARWTRVVTACVTACALIASACAPRPIAAPPVNDFVVVSNTGGLAGFDFAAGHMAYQAHAAVASADWARLYSSADKQLSTIDGVNGARLNAVPIPGDLEPVAASSDGSRVALSEPGDTASTWPPQGREHSRIVIADTTGATEPRVFDLRGNYQPDAFSSDGQRLFVLEFQPSAAPDHYRVRQLDLRTGEVTGMLSRSKVAVPEENMRGTRHSQVLSPDRHTLYTLYTNQPEHLHSRDLAAGLTESSGQTYAFVHVLNLLEGWAYCLDLPQPFGVGPAAAHALALSPDGRSLSIVDRASGTVAVADAEQLVLRNVANIGGSAATSQTSAAAAPDGRLFLTDASEVLTIAPRSLKVTNRFRIAGNATGLALSADGQRLFVSTDNRLIALDATTGSKLGELPAAGATGIRFTVSR
jgi:DNA-binding beta-propeller fold protein YncE